MLARYFEALDAGAFDEAAAQFSADVVYSHPPYRHTGIDSDDRLVFHGRDELRAAFTARGKQNFDHRVVVIGQAVHFASSRAWSTACPATERELRLEPDT